MAQLLATSLALALVVELAGAGVVHAEEAPPDVLIVLADDLDWVEVGESPTPSIDALAREGVTLRQFIGMPVCSPARHALLFGRWPRRDGVGGNVNSHAPPSARNPTPAADLFSLPKLLKTRGYHTALVGKWHLGQAAATEGADPALTAPLAHGFDHWLAGSPANLRLNVARHTRGLSGERARRVEARVRERARQLDATFYPEVLALFRLAERQGIDPLGIRGSASGAFGWPQFLPSSFLRFAVDGNGDRQVSLYDPADAVASAANYLAGHGWRSEMTRSGQRKVIWAYNHSDAYIDTVLSLAEGIERTHPSDVSVAARVDDEPRIGTAAR